MFPFLPKRSLILGVLSSLFFTSLYAYPPADVRLPYDAEIALADKYFDKALTLYDSAAFRSSLIYCKKAARIFKEKKVWEDYIFSLNGIGEIYRNLVMYDSAIHYLNQVLRASQEFGLRDTEGATYNNLGLCYEDLGDFENASIHYKKALKAWLKRFGPYHLKPATGYNNLGMLYWNLGDFVNAKLYLQKALDIVLQVLGPDHYIAAKIRSNLGLCYSYYGNYTQAVKFSQSALRTLLKILGPDHPDAVTCYSNLGNYYHQQGDCSKAITYYKKALKVWLKKLGPNHPKTVTSYNNLGYCYTELNNDKEAIYFLQKALEIQLKTLGPDHLNIAKTYNDLAIYYHKKEEYKKALLCHEKALKVRLKILGPNHLDVGKSYNNLSTFYSAHGDHEKAVLLLQKAINIVLKTLGPNDLKAGPSYNNLAKIFEEQGQFARSITYSQKTFSTIVKNFHDTADVYTNPLLEGIIFKKELLAALLQKTRTAEKLYRQTKKQKALDLSFRTALLAADLIDTIRNDHISVETKQALAESSSNVYETGLRTALQLYKLTKEKKYLHKAFSLSERSKSFLLLQSIKDSEAKEFSGIPDSVLEKEQDLKINIAFYEKQRFEAEHKKDSAELSMYQNYLFDSKSAFEKLIKQFETDFPEYYRLKYDTRVTSVKEIQTFLPKNTKFVEYFLGDSALYIFDVSKNNFRLHKIQKPEGFEDSLSAFRKSLTYEGFNEYADSDDEKKNNYFKRWVLQNEFLSESVLGSVLNNTINRLIIIPDGVLGYLPFETLLTKQVESGNPDFSKLPYLIRSHETSYAYSATLLLKSGQKKPTNSQELSKLKPFAGFAPTYKNQINEVEDTLRHDLAARLLRNGLQPLKYNIPEVNAAADFFKGAVFTGKNASKELFQSEAANYRILHLAMHTIIDDQNPMFSSLVFTKTNDSLSGQLEAAELYNMKLNARLVVLSACETGYGKLIRGEGIMSLSRAFSYTGVPSLLLSLWKVDDQASSELMIKFYEYLNEGSGIDEAVGRAKVDFITHPTHPFYSHPYFWAAFIPIGDMKPVPINKNNTLWFWLIGGGVIFMAGVFLFIRKNKKNSVTCWFIEK